jgi:tRNA/rRNA methyltransferase
VPQVRFVLVRPESAANVGACARIARNTGAEGLDLVSPGDWRTVECWRSAWGAQDLLEQARVFDELAAALRGVSLVAALTRRRPALGPSAADVRETASAIAALGRDEAVALVFGPETSGLTNEEMLLCGRTATIPAHAGQPSYNLSHAVAIAAYEVYRACCRRTEAREHLASHDEKERLLALLREGLLALRALPPGAADGHFAPWRGLVQRSDLTKKELRLLEHLGRKLALTGRGA